MAGLMWITPAPQNAPAEARGLAAWLPQVVDEGSGYRLLWRILSLLLALLSATLGALAGVVFRRPYLGLGLCACALFIWIGLNLWRLLLFRGVSPHLRGFGASVIGDKLF